MTSLRAASHDVQTQASELLETLRDWPWFETLRTLRQRFREDRLGLTAGSLTFTTMIALVPLFTVMLAVFSAFPMFSTFRLALEDYFLRSLVPVAIARPVLSALNDFAGNARGIGGVGAALLGLTAIATMLTIDRSLNGIWRVRQARPIAQRVLVYWAALTLGPLVVGISLSTASWALPAMQSAVGIVPDWAATLLGLLEFAIVAAAVTSLFHYVPNTWVRWRHALAGGIFVALAFKAAKAALAWYVKAVPGISVLYGTFATLPLLLLWIYLGWVIVLLGAVIAAYAPSLQMRVVRRPSVPGYRFELALAVLRQLDEARHSARRGLALGEVASALRADPLQIEPVFEHLTAIDWLARLDEEGAARLVLLVDPEVTPAAPLVDRLLLSRSELTSSFRQRAGIDGMTLAQLLR